MSTHPIIIRTITDMRQQIGEWRKQGLRVGLVPTMGALHAGHLSLINAMSPKVDKVIVSIFVNPTQFTQGEDFETYPRSEATDIAHMTPLQVDAVFAPHAGEIYADGFATSLTMGGAADGLESAARPHFFAGVALVVTKFLTICQPDFAIFGEKDYQQLLVIRRVVTDLNIPVEIIGSTTLREADGLAMSSRNVYLDAEQRVIAGALNKVLSALVSSLLAEDLSAALSSGDYPFTALEMQGKKQILAAGFDAVDYLTFRDADTLALPDNNSTAIRLLVAARIGTVRLIDNMPILKISEPNAPAPPA